MLVKAMPERLVRDPDTMRVLPEEGLPVADDNLHWIKAEADGDVALEPDPKPEAAA